MLGPTGDQGHVAQFECP